MGSSANLSAKWARELAGALPRYIAEAYGMAGSGEARRVCGSACLHEVLVRLIAPLAE